MMFEASGDRIGPPEVPPVEREGVRYAQAADGRALGHAQQCGVLEATDARTGAALWSLVVYGNQADPALEADVQWVYFQSMAFDGAGRLRIENEDGQAFLVDVDTRTVKAAP
ncbi:hypothetical protein [Pseudacidovorax sp. NFM-22]|uniref:hypothetical protein n=1 Tax=Pseudacidovorax sp. NFM-22 TaxID=2744469 RepID=UPI001F35846A|nr:hypothetical protein [Pseudacidovorax sp. NFM-22]